MAAILFCLFKYRQCILNNLVDFNVDFRTQALGDTTSVDGFMRKSLRFFIICMCICMCVCICVRVWHFGSNEYLSDIKNLVSFEGAMFEHHGFKHNTKILHVNISTSKCTPEASWTVYLSNIGLWYFYQYICGQIIKIILQKSYILISWSNTICVFKTTTILSLELRLKHLQIQVLTNLFMRLLLLKSRYLYDILYYVLCNMY